jgi:chromosome segregation ATPase
LARLFHICLDDYCQVTFNRLREQDKRSGCKMLRCKPKIARIGVMEKTVKTRAFPGNAKSAASQGNLTEAQEKTLELAKKNAQLEEVKGKLFEHLKTIEQLRESLKQEQARTAEMVRKTAGLEAKENKSAELEAKVKELTEALSKISNIATAGKAG